MLEILGTIFASVFSGGATGIIGVIAQRFADYKNKQLDMQLEKQRFDNAVALKEADAKIMAQEWAARTQVAKVEGETATNVADAQAFAASYQLEPQRYATGELTNRQRWVMVVLDAFRGSVRPMLTLYLCVLVTLIYLDAHKQLAQDDLDADAALDLFKLMLGTICYVWTTITLWWFGTRNKAQQPGA